MGSVLRLTRGDRVNDDDREFLSAFEECRLDKDCWSHSAHIRMAWLQIEKLGYDRAVDQIRESIRRYNGAVGSPGYNETVTVAFSQLIQYRRLAGDPCPMWREFLETNGDLLSKEKPALERFYTRETLFSEKARNEFLEPDLRPLPAMGRIRNASEQDAPGIIDIYAPFVRETPVSFETEVPGEAEIARRIQETTAYASWLVYEVDDTIAGYAYGGKHRARAAYRWAVEVSVYVHPDFRRRGVARLLYSQLLRRLTAQNFAVALGGVTLPNDPSVRLHEALGFEPVGVYPALGYKLGRWHDVGWWQKRLLPPGTPPAELLQSSPWTSS